MSGRKAICRKCGIQVRADRMDKHVETCRSGTSNRRQGIVLGRTKVFKRCHDCGKSVRLDKMERHIAVHQAEPRFDRAPKPARIIAPKHRCKCPKCKKEMLEDQLQKHLRIVHGEQQAAPVVQPISAPRRRCTCPMCHEEMLEGYLPKHLRMFHSDRERVPSQHSIPKTLPSNALPKCPVCGIQVRADRLAKHVAKAHAQQVPRNAIYGPIPKTDGTPEVQLIEPIVRDSRETELGALQSSVLPARPALIPCSMCSSQVREDRMEKHLSEVHPKRPGTLYPTPVKDLPLARQVLECPKCGAEVRADSMGLHTLDCRNSATGARPYQLGTLPFELLPPGKWEMRQVMDHYKRVASNQSWLGAGKIDLSRLRSIETLKPAKCYVGKESWRGYVVFEFTHSSRAVLECAMEGNATYVLSGDWRAMVGHTKSELRQEFAHRCIRIVHKNDWLGRLRLALRKG
jgi:hypothetical protein